MSLNLTIDPARITAHDQVCAHLNGLTDEGLSELLSRAQPLGRGIGGETLSIEVEKTRVFIKKIALSEIEKQHPRSTANFFQLPTYYQYGVGSMGFGTWRELAAHEMSTQWVLQQESPNFPLLYHSRVVPRSNPPKIEQHEAKLQDYTQYWGGSLAICARAKARDLAADHVVVFMEFIPTNLTDWLAEQLNKDETTAQQALSFVERELHAAVAFMQSKEFIHFDSHFGNILTDGKHLYFTDFGLAASPAFDLSPEEQAFMARHKNYDRYEVAAGLVGSIANVILKKEGIPEEKGDELWHERLITALENKTLSPTIQSFVERYLPVTECSRTFMQRLRASGAGKQTPYPEAELAALDH